MTQIGTTIGYCLTRNGAPTDDELVTLLEYSYSYTWQALWVQTAAWAATCGAPEWDEVILHAPTFAENLKNGPGRADRPEVVRNGLLAGPYRVQCKATGQTYQHVDAGHTFEYFLMTYANCTRDGVWVNGFCSFYPLGTNVGAELDAAVNGAGALADAAKQSGNFEQAQVGTNMVGIEGNHGTYGGGPGGLIHRTILTQCYPNPGGIRIRGRNLVAIGRLMGKIG